MLTSIFAETETDNSPWYMYFIKDPQTYNWFHFTMAKLDLWELVKWDHVGHVVPTAKIAWAVEIV